MNSKSVQFSDAVTRPFAMAAPPLEKRNRGPSCESIVPPCALHITGKAWQRSRKDPWNAELFRYGAVAGCPRRTKGVKECSSDCAIFASDPFGSAATRPPSRTGREPSLTASGTPGITGLRRRSPSNGSARIRGPSGSKMRAPCIIASNTRLFVASCWLGEQRKQSLGGNDLVQGKELRLS